MRLLDSYFKIDDNGGNDAVATDDVQNDFKQ